MKFSILTFGCRANQADSFRLEEELLARGHVAASPDTAELVLVNTCAVTGTAERQARSTIRRLARQNPAVRVVATGCYATRDASTLAALPNVIAARPNREKAALIEAIAPADHAIPATACAGPVPGARGRTIYPLLAQVGCNRRCSYCIVPATRGPSASRPLQALVRDAGRLCRAGYREIVLTGVHLGAWGRDLDPPRTLAALLSALERLPNGLTVRLSSIEPMDCSAGVIEILARADGRFAPHLHLPLQHASDRLLRAMRRPYTFEEYGRLVEQIRARLPHAAIGTDLIAGFPGETEADVELTERALADLPLAYAHVFAYSDRPGTEAAQLEPKVPGVQIRERVRRLAERARGVKRRFEAQQVGAIRPALTLGNGTVALTDNYIKVSIPPGLRRNERIRVRLTAAEPLQAEVIP
ncbi:MAG TPA: MiaB/RimO family radical SAM methylthiotransferase [Vicinamibacterales bacterium]|nr:MiaB/RimO family radical SAM methylthiotransferase [Vicinamibacterales bacterium]